MPPNSTKPKSQNGAATDNQGSTDAGRHSSREQYVSTATNKKDEYLKLTQGSHQEEAIVMIDAATEKDRVINADDLAHQVTEAPGHLGIPAVRVM